MFKSRDAKNCFTTPFLILNIHLNCNYKKKEKVYNTARHDFRDFSKNFCLVPKIIKSYAMAL